MMRNGSWVDGTHVCPTCGSHYLCAMEGTTGQCNHPAPYDTCTRCFKAAGSTGIS